MPFEPSSKGHSEAQIGRGLFWHDMHIGTTLRTYTRTITETDLVSFVTLTGMIDSGFLDATIVGPMGGRPVPGALTYSIIEGFIVQSLIRGTGIAMLGCTQEAIAPVHVGDTIYATIEFTGVRPTSRGNRAVVDSAITIFNQLDKPVLRYTSRRMIAGRPEAVE
ncbi:MaoC domain protein dehydratase [Parvibaculum lavamentivorans DS-1]|uniref:MaoC domain protein dehydratase n=1 Tax=Parvibaculum lavamentivorans (strain DS-1 / DSM 13023 / NCIMB 13966) TaxID=402881 RepID=A7HRX6_PARL1|nr:acyl dehydratase [Parvibaculum lavamentivorans]ABS62659.1 MaoC domain protein dehydratase [Parvibaculum lavamentivorans DS-1]